MRIMAVIVCPYLPCGICLCLFVWACQHIMSCGTFGCDHRKAAAAVTALTVSEVLASLVNGSCRQTVCEFLRRDWLSSILGLTMARWGVPLKYATHAQKK